MINHRHITVIIPALDEEESISRVIHDIPDCVDQILVVDNASQDATAVRAAQAGARVVHEPQKGYGKACLTGILVSGDTDILAFIDGDYSDYPEDLVRLLEPVAYRQCDLSIGCRQEDGDTPGGLFRHQRWGTQMACRVIRVSSRLSLRGSWADAVPGQKHAENCKWEMKGSAGRQRCN